jgi:hypothetical protein
VSEQLVIQRWPVKERRTNKDGRLLRTPGSYVRTKDVLEERHVAVLELTRSRVRVAFTTFEACEFGLTSGRCIGIPDWVIEKASLAAVRKARNLQFGTTNRKKTATAETDAAGVLPPEGA